jgi:hypothetical protein
MAHEAVALLDFNSQGRKTFGRCIQLARGKNIYKNIMFVSKVLKKPV